MVFRCLCPCCCSVIGIVCSFVAVFCVKPIIEGLTEEFLPKTCIVKNSTVQTLSPQVVLPKVLVRLDPSNDLRTASSEIRDLWACRYLEAYSSTKTISYEGGPKAWLSKFVVGDNISCWQSADDPDIVKLARESGASQCSIPGGCIDIWARPALYLGCAIVAFCAACCSPKCASQSDQGSQEARKKGYKPIIRRDGRSDASSSAGKEDSFLTSCCSYRSKY
mmetsp:Transcript_15730/g.25582  ORF Transcript_15730/g.25582 Transcript_15730/m.25582 type:complete len:221 (-) Transcript_15730:190-852(-)